ncbi:hypothetical protein ACFL21_01985 [Patescibacteria group bacterium]
MECSQYFTIGGLLLDIIGFWMLVYYNPETFNMIFEDAPSQKKKKYSKSYRKNVAICLVLTGFILQIIGTIVQ